jgi:hypothetical protein
MSQESMDELTDLSIQEFVKARFADTETNDAIQGMASAGAEVDVFLGKKTEEEAAADVQKVAPQVRADGSVIYHAFYTDMNQDQVLRPSLELRRFCRSQRGTMHAEENRSNELSAIYRARDVADAVGCIDAAYRTHPEWMSPKQLASGCQQNLAESRRTEDGTNDRSGAETGYGHAARTGAFGRFVCTQPPGAQRQSWAVLVGAVAFAPREQGSLMGHDLTLLIAPERSAAAANAEEVPTPEPAPSESSAPPPSDEPVSGEANTPSPEAPEGSVTPTE